VTKYNGLVVTKPSGDCHESGCEADSLSIERGLDHELLADRKKNNAKECHP